MDPAKVYDLLHSVTGARHRRMARFMAAMCPDEETTIIDIGGTPWTWADLPHQLRVTLVNTCRFEEWVELGQNMTFELGDGTELGYRDREFDIAFSNSVIEHLYTRENQVRFAREVTRVAHRVWVQTPAREFPLEPHLLAPFVHWLPASIRRRLVRYFTPWGWIHRPGREGRNRIVAEIKLLSRSDMAELFPDCEILVERWLGMPKSYVAFRQ